MRFVLPALLVTLLVLGAAPFVSPSVALDPDEAVKARQAVFKELGKNMKDLGGIAKSGDIEGQREQVIAAAGKIREISGEPWAYFGQETAVARVNTDARSTIWADPAGFRKAQDDFIAAAGALAFVTAKGDAKTVGEKIAALGATCGACHKQFKD